MRPQVHHAAVDCRSALNRRAWRRRFRVLLGVGAGVPVPLGVPLPVGVPLGESVPVPLALSE